MEPETKKSGWLILLHADDHVWRDRHIPLAERIASCDLIHRLMIEQQRAARAAYHERRERCPAHFGEFEPCPTCAAYIAAGL